MKLNLGSGGKRLEGWVNVDEQPMENPDIVCDLSREPWPFEDSSCEKAIASHVLEHLGPGPEPYFHFIKELWRVLKPGAQVLIVVPHPRHNVFLNDPTHQRAVTPDGLVMFSKKHWETMKAKGAHLTPFWKYLGVDFELVGPVQFKLDPEVDPEDPNLAEREQHEFNIVFEYHVVLKAVKGE